MSNKHIIFVCLTAILTIGCFRESSNYISKDTLDVRCNPIIDSNAIYPFVDSNATLYTGICKVYNSRGKLFIEKNYKENTLEGKQKIFYNNGKDIYCEINYNKHGRPSGIASVYYKRNRLAKYGLFNFGVIDSIWTFYLPNKRLFRTEEFVVTGYVYNKVKKYVEYDRKERVWKEFEFNYSSDSIGILTIYQYNKSNEIILKKSVSINDKYQIEKITRPNWIQFRRRIAYYKFGMMPFYKFQFIKNDFVNIRKHSQSPPKIKK